MPMTKLENTARVTAQPMYQPKYEVHCFLKMAKEDLSFLKSKGASFVKQMKFSKLIIFFCVLVTMVKILGCHRYKLISFQTN